MQAQYTYACACRDGVGVNADTEEAARWYRKAADQGHVKAQTEVGLAHLEGRGVEKDRLQAYYWRRKAAHSGDPEVVRQASELPPELSADEVGAVESWLESGKR